MLNDNVASKECIMFAFFWFSYLQDVCIILKTIQISCHCCSLLTDVEAQPVTLGAETLGPVHQSASRRRTTVRIAQGRREHIVITTPGPGKTATS